jgi:hypothetical protein
MLSLLCPQCGNRNPLLDGLAGKRIRCKQCSLLLDVPDPGRSQEGRRPSRQPTGATPEMSEMSRAVEKAPIGGSTSHSDARARGSRSSEVPLTGQRVPAVRDQPSRGWAWMATAALLLGLTVGAYGVFLLVSSG